MWVFPKEERAVCASLCPFLPKNGKEEAPLCAEVSPSQMGERGTTLRRGFLSQVVYTRVCNGCIPGGVYPGV